MVQAVGADREGPDRKKRRELDEDEREGVGFGSVFAILIEHGHRYEDVRDRYSAEEIEMFYALACERERQKSESLAATITYGVMRALAAGRPQA